MKVLVALAIFLGLFYAAWTGNLLIAFKAMVLVVLGSACIYSRLTAGRRS